MSGARAHQAAAGAATSISSIDGDAEHRGDDERRRRCTRGRRARCSARTGAARTKVKTIAIATGSSSGRACSSSEARWRRRAGRARPRWSRCGARRDRSRSVGAMARAMMAWPLPCRRDAENRWRRESTATSRGWIASESEDMATRRASAPSASTAKSSAATAATAAASDAVPDADRADARQVGRLAADRRRLPVRAEVGRLSRHRLSSARRAPSRSRAATCARSTATSPSFATPSSACLPDGAIVDGEIVVVGADGLDFDALQQRLHPAASRVAKLAVATPASFVAFDLLAAAGTSLRRRDPGSAPRRAREAARRAPARRST